MKNFDLITIGDNATDAFIRLKEAELDCDINKEQCKICMGFASKIPYESVTIVPAGGNSSNVSIGSAKLGLETAYISNVGNDLFGQETLNKLKENNVETNWIKINSDTPTNYNYVLWYKDDRTILVKHQKYDYELPNINSPKWIYLSSLGENSLVLHQTLANFLNDNPEIKLAFNPGTMQIRAGYEKMSAIYKSTEVLFVNKQEAQKILQTKEDDIIILLNKTKELGPKTVIITDGNNGAHALNSEGIWHSPIYSVEHLLIERTGAGDAFASAFISATVQGKDITTALSWGAINSASVVGQIGPHAGLMTREQIENILANLKTEFSIKEITQQTDSFAN